jgi:hypothetical protein
VVFICSAIGEDAQRKLSNFNMLVGKDFGFCLAIRVDCHMMGESKKVVLRLHNKKEKDFEVLSEKLDSQFQMKSAKLKQSTKSRSKKQSKLQLLLRRGERGE